MGYILPVNHYQYKDYHDRTIQTERSPFMLEQIFKTTLDNRLKQQEQSREEDRLEYQEMSRKLFTSKDMHAVKNPWKPAEPAHEKVYSDVTGKGKHFSESI